MAAKFKSANLYYGASRYPISKTDDIPDSIPFAKLAGTLLDRICYAVAEASGCLTMQLVKERIRHNVATERLCFPGVMEDGSDAVVPAKVQLIGNGFSVIWEVAE